MRLFAALFPLVVGALGLLTIRMPNTSMPYDGLLLELVGCLLLR